jgi:hypothetical protein
VVVSLLRFSRRADPSLVSRQFLGVARRPFREKWWATHLRALFIATRAHSYLLEQTGDYSLPRKLCGNQKSFIYEFAAIRTCDSIIVWQLATSHLYSCGEQIERGYLTDLFAELVESEKRRGPHTMLTDNQILARREQLVQAFEGLWGEIGWELQKSKKESDLLRALRPLNKVAFVREVASVFFHKARGLVSAATVRQVRIRLRKIQLTYRDAEVEQREILEKLECINALLPQCPNNKLRPMKRAQKRQRKEASISKQKWRELSRVKKELEDQLRELEAGFTRQEIFRFCKSRRYELNPLNLANAAAGLPFMGWRQSMRRCTKQRRTIADGLDYQIFKAVRFMATNASKSSANDFIVEFRESIPQLPSRYRAPKAELANQWLFLERAIRSAFRSKPHPRAFPFEITKCYFQQIRSRSQIDIILAQQAKLTPARKK